MTITNHKKKEVSVPKSAIARMLQLVRESGRDESELVYLVRGEPDFNTPAHIRQALSQAVEAEYTHYPPIAGYPDLRQAIAEQRQTKTGIPVDPDEVLITTGATMGMYVALQALITPGDDVLLPAPIYDVYLGQIAAAGGRAVQVKAGSGDAQSAGGAHFHIPMNLLEEALTPDTRAIILNTPWNPTGTVMTQEELQTIGAFAIEHDLYVLVDEIYEELVYDTHKHYSIACLFDAFRSRTITINSFSKTYAMTGWRIGYNIAPQVLIEAMLHQYRQSSRGSSAFVQRAGLAAIRGPWEPVARMVAEYTQRRKLLVNLVNQIEGVRCLAPEGTFFCLVDIRNLRQTSEAIARHLLQDVGLVIVPGSFYGPTLDGFLRLSFSYSQDNIRRGVERLADSIHRRGI